MDLFTPLSKEYCLYFYILSVLGFILMSIALIFGVFGLFSKNGTKNMGKLFMVVSAYFILYFQNRLLYSMCVNASSGASSAAADAKIGGAAPAAPNVYLL